VNRVERALRAVAAALQERQVALDLIVARGFHRKRNLIEAWTRFRGGEI
jgi:hypothetical protein